MELRSGHRGSFMRPGANGQGRFTVRPFVPRGSVASMSSKSARIAHLAVAGAGGWDGRYLGYFEQFNLGRYFEAHDVLEDLWLAEGRSGANYAFHKGLIQLAGAFVHLQKGRLRPAAALFALADTNLAGYGAARQGLDLRELRRLIADWDSGLRRDGFSVNPLAGRPAPRLALPAHS